MFIQAHALCFLTTTHCPHMGDKVPDAQTFREERILAWCLNAYRSFRVFAYAGMRRTCSHASFIWQELSSHWAQFVFRFFFSYLTVLLTEMLKQHVWRSKWKSQASSFGCTVNWIRDILRGNEKKSSDWMYDMMISSWCQELCVSHCVSQAGASFQNVLFM